MAKQSPWSPNKFLLWLTFSVMITAFCGLVYLVVQQDMRQGANDPQIQIANDTSVALGAGQKVTPVGSVDIARSLAPFVIIYDSQGHVMSTGARLNSQTPELPSGVLQNAKNNGELRFTWQPQVDVRIAAVVVPYSGGYVLAGRSLREIEKREDKLLFQVEAAWAVTMGTVTVLSFLL